MPCGSEREPGRATTAGSRWPVARSSARRAAFRDSRTERRAVQERGTAGAGSMLGHCPRRVLRRSRNGAPAARATASCRGSGGGRHCRRVRASPSFAASQAAAKEASFGPGPAAASEWCTIRAKEAPGKGPRGRCGGSTPRCRLSTLSWSTSALPRKLHFKRCSCKGFVPGFVPALSRSACFATPQGSGSGTDIAGHRARKLCGRQGGRCPLVGSACRVSGSRLWPRLGRRRRDQLRQRKLGISRRCAHSKR